MSRVFVAREHALNRTVVVKVLRPELAADVNRERFRREIILAAQLQHPLIVPVIAAGEHREQLWYTMPYIEGESLREEIRRGQPASARSAMRVLHDVLDALAYAHARGVVHRDIKPGNILRHGNHSLVTDFGVAKALSAAMPSSGTTSAGIAIGTPAYMAPEQLAADPKADHRMDIYAVGLLVYELLTGAQAFAESSPQATMAAQLTRMPRDLAEVRPDVPAPLASLIMRMLAKNPDDRPRTASDALNELDAIATPTSTSAPRWMGRSRTSRWLIGGVAALGLAAVASLAHMYRRGDSPAAARPLATADSSRAARTRSDTLPSARAAAPAARPATKTQPAATTKTVTSTKSPTTKTRPAPTRATAPTLNRRVAVLPFRFGTNRENVVNASQQVHDSLRNALTAAGYTLASDSELLRLVSQQNISGGMRRAADAAGIGAVVLVDVVARGDEVTAITQIVDVWRSQTASARDVADLDKPQELVSLVRNVGRALDRVSWRTRSDPKRVLIFETENMTGMEAVAPLAREVDDSLRAAAARFGASVIPQDSTTRATRDVMERRTLAVRRGAGAIVATTIMRVRVDTVLIRMSVRDMSEDRTFPNVEGRVHVNTLSAALPVLAERLTGILGQVNWGPKLTPTP